jgi:hypothetical protein
MMPDVEGALSLFRTAADYVRRAGLHAEIEWQRQTEVHDFGETDFLREAAWVILCSGFREKVVRRVFDYISLCFCDWESAAAILEADPACRVAAMYSFGHTGKLSAIVGIARYIYVQGFPEFKQAVLTDPIAELRRLPYIGVVTVWHLAKNLGFDVAKPDRHLTRISARFGFCDADYFCAELARETGQSKKVVDLIVWRYLADNPLRRS